MVGCGNPLYVEFGMEIFKRTREGQTLYILSDSDSEDVGRVVISVFSDVIRVHTLFVKPEYRDKGYGKALIEAVLRDYPEKRISLCTGLGNIEFFERLNFKVCEEAPSDSLFEMTREPL